MKRWLKRTLFGVFGASIVLGGLTACARGHGGGAWANEADSTKMREHFVDRAAKQLQLDDAQKQRLSFLADKIREQRVALMGTVGNGAAGDPRAELQALVAGSKFDRGQAQAFVEAKTAAVRVKSPEVIAAAGDFFDSLRPEQQEQVRAFMNKHRGRGRGQHS